MLGPACASWRENPNRISWPYFARGHSRLPPKQAAKTTAAENVTAKNATPIAIVMGPPGHNPTIGTPCACRCRTPRGKYEPIHRRPDALQGRRRFRRKQARSGRHGVPGSVHQGAGARLSSGAHRFPADSGQEPMPFDAIHEPRAISMLNRGRV